MRSALAHVILFLVGSWMGRTYLLAQTAAPPPAPTLRIEADTTCPASSIPHPDAPPGPDISFAEVEFFDRLQLPVSEQQRIGSEIKENVHGFPLAGLVEEALERAKFGWRNHGYFNVEVQGDTKTLTSTPTSERLSLRIHVEEGHQYRLGGITFKNNKAITDVDALRRAFPIQDGEILSQEKIGKGLEEIRRTYGKLGYINFTPDPETRTDEGTGRIYIDIDMDEGKPFRVGSIEVVTADPAVGREFLDGFPLKAGDIYNSELWEAAIVKKSYLFQYCPCVWRTQNGLDEKTGTVNFRFDLRPCPED